MGPVTRSGDSIHLSESSKVVINLFSSDDDDDSCSSEDEEDDESCSSANVDADERDEDKNRRGTKSIASKPAGKLLAADVAKLIKGGDLNNVKVDDCRAYLRQYRLRIAGTKAVLVDRIKEHIEFRESGSIRYHRSTFTINCTGDVCKGDVVVFEQKIKKVSVIPKSPMKAGKRIVAGRVVSESYGAQRQQHTFTVEVLWSTGCCPLAPMKQLLVKGRYLYKRGTYRQRWADEGERQRSVDEKHNRGAAARQVRAKRQRIFNGGCAPGRFGRPSTNSKNSASADHSRRTYPHPTVRTSLNGSRPLAQVSKTSQRSRLVEGFNFIQSRTSPKRPPVAVPVSGFPYPTGCFKNTGSEKYPSGVYYQFR